MVVWFGLAPGTSSIARVTVASVAPAAVSAAVYAPVAAPCAAPVAATASKQCSPLSRGSWPQIAHTLAPGTLQLAPLTHVCDALTQPGGGKQCCLKSCSVCAWTGTAWWCGGGGYSCCRFGGTCVIVSCCCRVCWGSSWCICWGNGGTVGICGIVSCHRAIGTAFRWGCIGGTSCRIDTT